MRNRAVLVLAAALLMAVCVFTTSCSQANPSRQDDNGKKANTKSTQTVCPSKPSNEKKNSNSTDVQQQSPTVPGSPGSVFQGSIILGRPSADSIVLNMLAPADLQAYIQYGMRPGEFGLSTPVNTLKGGIPQEVELKGLQADTQYYYRVSFRGEGESSYNTGTEAEFHTQRSAGSRFSFGVQGDSHPERLNRMFDPVLYQRTMNNVAVTRPDLYFLMGDDFSIEHLIGGNKLNQQAVDSVYEHQRSFLGFSGSSSALFLVNGNHEQAARYLLDGTAGNPAVLAGLSRLKYYSLPSPDMFYSGDAGQVEFVGLPRDYYAWTWGDALFVVIDPYWHSPVAVDNPAGGGEKRSNMWDITLGEQQYDWLKQTLEVSTARFKFVFAHHVNGTGRGGVELARLYEWGGRDARGNWLFNTNRPGWEMPVHQLMVKSGVTIFFQGHDHLFARQQLDGVVYQTVPCPADPTYQAFNGEAYRTGDVLPNSGFLNVTVSDGQVKVDYIRSFLPGDEKDGRTNGQVAFSYIINK